MFHSFLSTSVSISTAVFQYHLDWIAKNYHSRKHNTIAKNYHSLFCYLQPCSASCSPTLDPTLVYCSLDTVYPFQIYVDPWYSDQEFIPAAVNLHFDLD